MSKKKGVSRHSVDLIDHFQLSTDQDDDALDRDIRIALFIANLSMEVRLYHRPTGRVAMLYSSGGDDFTTSSPGEELLLTGAWRAATFPDKDLSFHHRGKIHVVDGGAERTLWTYLEIECNRGASSGDCKSWIESLHWM